MQNINLQLNSFNEPNNEPNNTERTEWIFYVSANHLIAGENMLEISGLDFAENQVSANPAVSPVHQQNGTWFPYVLTGLDCFHSFGAEIAYGPPVPNFEADILFPNVSENVTFTSDSQDGGQLYEWDFVHSSNITLHYAPGYDKYSQNPIVYFMDGTGNVNVTLTITNDNGIGTETKDNYIQIVGSSANPPIPDFSTTTGLTTIASGHTIDFVDLSAPGTPATWFSPIGSH